MGTIKEKERNGTNKRKKEKWGESSPGRKNNSRDSPEGREDPGIGARALCRDRILDYSERNDEQWR